MQGDEGRIGEGEGYQPGQVPGSKSARGDPLAWDHSQGSSFCGANVHDLRQAERLLAGMGEGWVLADRNYWSETVAEQLRDHDAGPTLLARFKRKGKTEQQRGLVWPRWLSARRQKIETIFSQLVERYRLKVVWARDGWHFSSRFVRKILSHTMAVVFCQKEGISPTRFSELLSDH